MGQRSLLAQRQAPLRALYATDPEEALTYKWARTSSADLAPLDDPFHTRVEVGREHPITLRLGIDRHVGGLGDLPNPGDLLCAALAACEDGTIRMIASVLGVRLTALEVEAQGTVDVRGCLGVDPHAQVGFTGFWSTVRLQPGADTPPRLIDKLIETTKRVCVNLDTLQRPNTIELIVDSASAR